MRRAVPDAVMSHESQQARGERWLLAQPSRALRPWWASAHLARHHAIVLRVSVWGWWWRVSWAWAPCCITDLTRLHHRAALVGGRMLGSGVKQFCLEPRLVDEDTMGMGFVQRYQHCRRTALTHWLQGDAGGRAHVWQGRRAVLLPHGRRTGLTHWRCRATLVGERTFGKGVVQYYFPTAGDRPRRSGGVAAPADGSGLKVTVAKYITAGARRPAARFLCCMRLGWLITQVMQGPAWAALRLSNSAFVEFRKHDQQQGVSVSRMHGTPKR